MKLPESLKVITDTLWQIKDKKDLEWVLEDLLTPSEVIAIAERVSLLKLLKQGKSQRDVAEELGISVTTVTRWSRLLKYDATAIDKYL